jgi:hypothetical protein
MFQKQADMRQRVRALLDQAEKENWEETRRRCLLSTVCDGNLPGILLLEQEESLVV